MRSVLGLTVMILLVSSCGTEAGAPPAPAVPPLDEELVAMGEEVYRRECASCHGADLSGAPDWRTPNPDGSYPPPPHDETGHTWHHPDRVLVGIIRDGSDFEHSRMPVYGDVLTDEEIDAVVAYLKSRWGPDQRAYQWQMTLQDRAG